MIVNINESNFQEYTDIFAEAFNVLKSKNYDVGLDADPKKTTFSGLAEYYSHMADLLAISAYRYVMLPLDEETFTINLNDRSIIVPAGFSKCASVQTDQLAETIVFVVDRYFDYMDLNNTEIYVQWITPSGTHGATHVEMRDIESEPNKIRFAWPLNKIVTEKPGNVQFSVRFVRVDKNEQVIYSLNTLNKEIVIKPALYTKEPTIVIEKQNIVDEFKNAIINSKYMPEGIPEPMTPSFGNPGSDITINPQNLDNEKLIAADSQVLSDGTKVYSLNENDTLTLYAQAVTPDSGTIKYEWFFIPEGETKPYPCADYPTEGAGFGTVVQDEVISANAEFADGEIPSRNFPERYYDENDAIYTGPFPTKNLLNTKFTTYTVNPADKNIDINGTYYARAVNVVSVNGTDIESTHYAQTSKALIPGPKEIVIDKDLAQGLVIDDLSANLSIELADDNYNPEIKYIWSSNSASDVIDFTSLENNDDNYSNDASLNVTLSEAPAWYGVKVYSSLNRKEKTKESKICKVTLPPVPPTVVSKRRDDTIDGNLSDGPVTLTIEAAPTVPTVVEGETAKNLALYSEQLHYVWQYKPIDNVSNANWTTVDKADNRFEGQGTDTLKVINIEPYGGILCRCLVINELNGRLAIFDHSNTYEPDENEPLGEFLNKAPYIYAETNDTKLSYTYSVRF